MLGFPCNGTFPVESGAPWLGFLFAKSVVVIALVDHAVASNTYQRSAAATADLREVRRIRGGVYQLIW